MNIFLISHYVSELVREQELQNLLQKRDYVNAVGLAITLNQPFRVLTILTGEL